LVSGVGTKKQGARGKEHGEEVGGSVFSPASRRRSGQDKEARGKEHGEEVGGQCSAQQLATEAASLIEQETSCKYTGFHEVLYEVSSLMVS